jgi:hypothetical protein
VRLQYYRAAFAPAPFHETDVEAGWFAQELAADLQLGGFRCCVARHGEDLGGFAYGFDAPATLPSAGWYSSLLDAVGPQAAERWVLGQFAVGWLAVRPGVAGAGARPAAVPAAPRRHDQAAGLARGS